MKLGNKSRASVKVAFVAFLAIVILAVFGLTLAGIRNVFTGQSDISFDKISISANNSVSINNDLDYLIPGANLIDDTVTFSKDADSAPVYVRAFVRFVLAQSGTAEQVNITNQYIQAFNSVDYGVFSESQDGAVWVLNDGYYYLSDDTSSGTLLKKINTQREYSFINSFVISEDLLQITEDSSKLLKVKFEIVIQAIQAEGIPSTIIEAKSHFDSTF